jgi:molybdopterin-guanine dinucleotide biosynthesis protein A
MEHVFGAIIVCGGKSSRMGTPKALLPFGSETMIERMVRVVCEACAGPIVVVAAREQPLPPLPSDVRVAFDEHEALGPLEGLRVGLAALREARESGAACEVAFMTSCDAPLLRPEFIRRVCDALTAVVAAAVPRSGGYLHPLAAAYRIDSALPHVERLVAARKLRAAGLFDEVATRILEEDELRAVDPTLKSLRTMNTPEEYEALLRLAGLQPRTKNQEPRTLP